MQKYLPYFLLGLVLISVTDAQSQASQLRRKRPNPQGQGQRFSAAPVTEAPSSGISDACPEPNGFFPDAYQCDKYYKCTDGKISEKICPDGLVFIDAGPEVEKCEFEFAVDCTGRPERQPAQVSQNCPRKNGYFAHEDTKVCDKFYFCVDGMYNAITCPAGLVFSDKTGTCTWPDQAKKLHCSSGELFEFDCPKIEGALESGQMVHPRYADPKDCQFFYVCIDGKVPRKNGCSTGQVFNEKSGMCDKPKNVPECKDWYKGILDYDQEGEIVTTTVKPKPRPAADPNPFTGGSRRKNKRPNQQLPQQFQRQAPQRQAEEQEE